MLPYATCPELMAQSRDAVHIRDRGVDARPDPEVAAVAVAEDRALVTENVEDFTASTVWSWSVF